MRMKRNFRQMIENNKWLKKVPTMLTICNSLCGFAAIVYTLHVYDRFKDTASVLELSAWIILGAMIFDVLDGFTARIFNAASMHGVQMDSLADMVTFGLAPAVIVAVMAHRLRDLKTGHYYLIWGLCGIYLGCAAFRLATYNVHAILEKKSSDKFKGLPTPGAASAVCSLVIFYSICEKELKPIVSLLPVYAGLLGVLMISDIPYLHVGRWIQSARRNNKRLILLLLLFLALAYKPASVTVLVINGYILSGPVGEFVSRIIRWKRRRSSFSTVRA